MAPGQKPQRPVFSQRGSYVMPSLHLACDDLTAPVLPKMSSCTRMVHKCPKIQEDHTATIQSTETARVPYDICVISMSGCGDLTIYVQSLHGLSMALHRSIVETCQKITRWPYKC